MFDNLGRQWLLPIRLLRADNLLLRQLHQWRSTHQFPTLTARQVRASMGYSTRSGSKVGCPAHMRTYGKLIHDGHQAQSDTVLEQSAIPSPCWNLPGSCGHTARSTLLPKPMYFVCSFALSCPISFPRPSIMPAQKAPWQSCIVSPPSASGQGRGNHPGSYTFLLS